jgi:hypothetical protein
MMRKHISTVIVVGILLGAMVFAAGCTSNVNNTPTPSVASATRDPKFVPKNTSSYLTYSNRSAGISIQYPSSWQKQEGTAGGIVSFNVSGVPEMSFTVTGTQDFSGTATTLNDFSQDALTSLQQQLTDFKLNNSTNSTLSGYPAKKLVFTYANNDLTTSAGMLQLTLVNRTGYGLLYEAEESIYPTYLGIAQNMTQSFNITK